jgi:tetratricopeptide (TPR) repeat protein
MNLWMICWGSNQIEHMLNFAEQAEGLARLHPQISPDERAWALWARQCAASFWTPGRSHRSGSRSLHRQAGQDQSIVIITIYWHWCTLQAPATPEYYEASIQIWRELNHRLFKASVLGNLGENLRTQGDFQAALNCYRQALELNRRVGILDTSDVTMMNVGAVLVNLGQYSAALEQLELARSPRPALLPMYGEWYAIYSLACLGVGETEQAAPGASGGHSGRRDLHSTRGWPGVCWARWRLAWGGP